MFNEGVLRIVALLVVCAFAAAQGYGEIVVRGCLSGGPHDLYLAPISGGDMYRLSGRTAVLASYNQREITIVGRIDTRDGSFRVLRLKNVFDLPKPVLDPSFRDASGWQRVREGDGSLRRPHFASNTDARRIGTFDIPANIFPGSNFAGGVLSVFVNPAIRNAAGCRVFSNADARFRSSRRISGITYWVKGSGGAAAGTFYSFHDFHTFQNGVCYEIGFEFREGSTGNYDLGCRIPALTQADEFKVTDSVLAKMALTSR